MPTLENDDLVPASRQGAPKPELIVDKYLQALGGAQRLTAMTSWAATGTSMGFGGFGGAGRVEIYAKAPDLRSTIIRFPEAPDRDASVRSFDGKIGWIKTPLSVLGEYQLSGSEFDGARLDAQLSFPGQITQVLTNLRTLDPVTIDGKSCDVVQGDSQRRTFATLFFEKRTGLLVRTMRFGPSPIGRIPTQIDYSDYRDVNGVKMPFRFTLSWLDGRDEFQLNHIQVNVPIAAIKFGRPDRARVGAVVPRRAWRGLGPREDPTCWFRVNRSSTFLVDTAIADAYSPAVNNVHSDLTECWRETVCERLSGISQQER